MKEVSIQEMLEYRQEGFTNREIAEMLGVAPNTIYAHIGKMPPELRSKAARESWETRGATETAPIAPESATTAEESPVLMLTTNEVITVASPNRKYTIDRDAGTVHVKSIEGTGEMILRYEDIDTLVIELRMLRKKMGDSIGIGIQPW